MAYKIGEIINKDEMGGSFSPWGKRKEEMFEKYKRGGEYDDEAPPVYTAPELGEMPTYEMPETITRGAPAGGGGMGGDRVEALTQRIAAPGLRNLRQQMLQVGAQTYSNPNVKSMTLRQALAGYGAGLESVMSGARATAGQEASRNEQIAIARRNAEMQREVESQRTEESQARYKYETETRKTAEENRRIEEAARINYENELKEYYAEQEEERLEKYREPPVTPIRYAGSSAPGGKPSYFTDVASPTSGREESSPYQSYDLSALLDMPEGGGYESAPLMSDEEWEKYINS